MVGDDLNHWKGYIHGPVFFFKIFKLLQEGTVYEKGLFQIDISLTPEYPYKPPKVTSFLFIIKKKINYIFLKSWNCQLINKNHH